MVDVEKGLISADALKAVIDNVGACIYIKDLKGHYLYVNQQVADLFQVSSESIVGQTDEAFFDLNVSAELREFDRKVTELGEVQEGEERNFVRREQGFRVFWSVKKPLRDEQGHIIGMFGISTDITERKRMEEQLRVQSIQDELTQLYNRRYFFTEGEKKLEHARRLGEPSCVLVLDLDHFKDINDEYGHLTGDKVLIEVAKRISSVVRKTDLLARVGGEEFALLLHATHKSKALELAEAIRNKVAQTPIVIDAETAIELSLSVGVHQDDDSTSNFVDSYRMADRMLYKAKNEGRNRVFSR